MVLTFVRGLMVLDLLGLAHVWCGMVSISHVKEILERTFLAVTRVLGDDVCMHVH